MNYAVFTRIAAGSCLAMALLSGAPAAVAGTAKAQVAEVKQQVPHQIVESVTAEVLKVVSEHKALLKTDPQAYYAKVGTVLDKPVPFPRIARLVMGKKNWASASKKQQDSFGVAFRDSMVETLAKGLANFSDLEVVTHEGVVSTKSDRQVRVKQEVAGGKDPYTIVYSMYHDVDKTGDWLLTDVNLNGISLRRQFTAQFQQMMRSNNNDIDKVIAGWSQS